MQTFDTHITGTFLNRRGRGKKPLDKRAKIVSTGIVSWSRPTANGQRPTANGQRPTANGQRPTANGQRPTANGQPLTASGLAA